MHRIAVLPLIVLFISTFEAAAEDDTRQLMMLTGGLPIRVIVGDLSSTAKNAGVTEEFLENLVELGLRRNRIPLPGDYQDAACRAAIEAIPPGETRTLHECAVPLGTFLERLMGPLLLVTALVLEVHVGGQNVGYTYYTEIELSQSVTLNPEARPNHVARASSIDHAFTALWKNGEIGVAGNADKLKGAIRRFLFEQIDAFSLEYLRALE